MYTRIYFLCHLTLRFLVFLIEIWHSLTGVGYFDQCNKANGSILLTVFMHKPSIKQVHFIQILY